MFSKENSESYQESDSSDGIDYYGVKQQNVDYLYTLICRYSSVLFLYTYGFSNISAHRRKEKA